MGSSKDLFIQEREREMYEETMPQPKRATPYTKPATVKESHKDLNRVRNKINALKLLEGQLIQHIKETAFIFENDKNYPQGLICDMAISLKPYYYCNPGNLSRFRSSVAYEGDQWNKHYTKLIRNPFFDWQSEKGKTLTYKEKKYYETF